MIIHIVYEKIKITYVELIILQLQFCRQYISLPRSSKELFSNKRRISEKHKQHKRITLSEKPISRMLLLPVEIFQNNKRRLKAAFTKPDSYKFPTKEPYEKSLQLMVEEPYEKKIVLAEQSLITFILQQIIQNNTSLNENELKNRSSSQ